MSLINDALKRAKDAQQQTPPPPADHLHLRPVEPHVVINHGLGFAVPVGFALLALLLLFFGWRLYQYSNQGLEPTLTVRAKTPPAPLSKAEEKPAPTIPETPRAVARAPLPGPNGAAEPAKVPLAEPAASAATNAAVVEPPKPAPLKLQGVTYSRNRPSAVINGKTLFLGDRIREFRVVAILPDSATLVGAGQTNVLSLSE